MVIGEVPAHKTPKGRAIFVLHGTKPEIEKIIAWCEATFVTGEWANWPARTDQTRGELTHYVDFASDGDTVFFKMNWS